MSETLPQGWHIGPLNEIVNSVKTGVPEFKGEKEYYSTGSIQGKIFIPEGIFSFNNKPSRANRIAIKDDVFQARMKETDKSLIADDELSEQLFSTGFLQLRPYGETYSSKLLYYYISSPSFLNQKDELATGSTQEALTDNNAINLFFPLPPLNEQKRIVARLEQLIPRITAVKERLDKIPAIIKRFKQSVLTAAVTGKLTEKWRIEHPDVESAKVLLSLIKKYRIENAENQRELNTIKNNYEAGKERLELKESPYELPESWCFCEISNIGNVNNGSTPSRKINQYWDGNINWVSSGEVANSSIKKTRETITEKGFKNSSVKLLPVGTVLIAMIGEGKTRGQTAILEIKSTCNQNVAAVVINHGLVLSKYLYLWFLMQYERNRSYGSGSGPKALNCQRVRELDFILPPLEEQKEIVRQVDKLFVLADRLESHYQKAKVRVDKLSQSVLAKAFRGELVITEAELAEKEGRDFESAEKLLERILEEKAKITKTLRKKK